jgi:glucose-6-phosphate 1-epimerase
MTSIACEKDSHQHRQGAHINIQQLNADFGIDNQVVFVEGKGGLPFIQINTPKASALISIYAGQVLSFRPADEPEDLMFISDNAFFKQGKAIKGSIPICWPWFGAAPENPENPDHGFVRNDFWSVVSTEMLESAETKITLKFVDNDYTQKLWPHHFQLTLEITIGQSLTLDLITKNTGTQAFRITEALHAYFNVGDSSKVKIRGLEQTEYLDKTENFIKACQIDSIEISAETDQIYTAVKHDLSIEDPILDRTINISSIGNKNIIVWNPWVKGSESSKDLQNDAYKYFVCVETANAATNYVTIKPDEQYQISTNYSVIRQYT